MDTTTVKLVEVRGRDVVKWASLSFEPIMSEDGVILEPQTLSTVVRQLIRSSGIRAKNVIASVGGLYSVSRIVAVSPLEPGGVIGRDSVLGAIKDVMPLPLDELYISWRVITGDDGVQQYFVVGVPRDVVDAEMQALRLAGITPHVLDLENVALARAVNKERALILNIERYSYDIVIVVDGIPKIMRTVDWSRDDLTNEERMENLVVNLELTVAFYNSNQPDNPLDLATPFIITGQMAEDLNIIEKMKTRVGYSIESFSPPLECPKHMPISQYAVNIGLALRGMASDGGKEQNDISIPDINLIPEEYKPWKPSTKQIYFTLGVVAAIVLLFPLYQITSGALDKTADLQTRYNILNNSLQQKQLEIARREPIKNAISEYNSIVNSGRGVSEDLGIIANEAERLGVQVESITHSGESITIVCRTEPENHILFREYVTALSESGRFSEVSSPPEAYSYVTGGSIKLVPKIGN
ncbi:pilus assembly protein PilM [Chloroflexota bacterium]